MLSLNPGLSDSYSYELPDMCIRAWPRSLKRIWIPFSVHVFCLSDFTSPLLFFPARLVFYFGGEFPLSTFDLTCPLFLLGIEFPLFTFGRTHPFFLLGGEFPLSTFLFGCEFPLCTFLFNDELPLSIFGLTRTLLLFLLEVPRLCSSSHALSWSFSIRRLASS